MPPGRNVRGVPVPLRVEVSLPPDLTAPRVARDAAVHLAPAVPKQTLDDVRVLVSELVTNAVLHADLQREEAIELGIGVEPGHVDVIVRYPEHRGFLGALSLEPDKTSGWGLFLVDRIADRWSVVATRGFTEAWCELDLPHPEAA